MRASLMRWHRRLGLGAALLVVLASVSGLLVNHADALGLARWHLQAPWLMRLYGLQTPPLRAAYPLGAHWISQWGARLVLDAEPLKTPDVQQMIGAFALGDAWAVADHHRLLLLTPDGELVDSLPLPQGHDAVRAAADGARVVVETAAGRRLRTDEALSRWDVVAHGSEPLPWAASQPLPEPWRSAVPTRWRGDGVSAERVLLDLHSGRWLGRAGVWLMDGVAIVLLLLAGTGAHTVWQRWRRTAARPHEGRQARRTTGDAGDGA